MSTSSNCRCSEARGSSSSSSSLRSGGASRTASVSQTDTVYLYVGNRIDAEFSTTIVIEDDKFEVRKMFQSIQIEFDRTVSGQSQRVVVACVWRKVESRNRERQNKRRWNASDFVESRF